MEAVGAEFKLGIRASVVRDGGYGWYGYNGELTCDQILLLVMLYPHDMKGTLK